MRNCVLTDTRSAAVTSSRHLFVQHRTRDNRVFHRLDSAAWRANVYLLCGETSERGQCTQQPHWRPAAAALQESLLGRRRHHVGGRLPAMVPTVARYDDLVNRRFKAELRAIPVHRGRTQCRRLSTADRMRLDRARDCDAGNLPRSSCRRPNPPASTGCGIPRTLRPIQNDSGPPKDLPARLR